MQQGIIFTLLTLTTLNAFAKQDSDLKPKASYEVQVTDCRGGPRVNGKLTLMCKTIVKPKEEKKK